MTFLVKGARGSTVGRSVTAGLVTATVLCLLWTALTPQASETESLKVWAAARAAEPPRLGPISHMAAAPAQWALGRLVGVTPLTLPRPGYRTMRHVGAALVAIAAATIGLAAALLVSGPATAPLAVLAASGTWTFTAHAINPWETAWALPLVAAALAAGAAAHRSGRLAWSVAAGLLIVGAGFVYLVSFAATPAVAWLATSPFGTGRGRRRIVAWTTFCAGVALAGYFGFAAASWAEHRSIWGPIRAYNGLRDEGLWGALRLTTALGLPFGWVNATVGLLDWRGVRHWLAAGPGLPVLWRLLVAIVVIAGTLALLLSALRRPGRGDVAVTGLLLLGCGTIPPWLWATPAYLKLWIVGTLSLPFAVIAAQDEPPRVRQAVGVGVLVLLLVTVGTTLVPLFQVRDYTGEAARWLTQDRPGARFIAVGWEGLSDELAALDGASVFSITQEALGVGGPPVKREPRLRLAVAHARDLACAEGRSVYLLGLASITPAAWDPFLGRRVGISYQFLEWLRDAAAPDTTLTVRDGEGGGRRVIEVSRLPCPASGRSA